MDGIPWPGQFQDAQRKFAFRPGYTPSAIQAWSMGFGFSRVSSGLDNPASIDTSYRPFFSSPMNMHQQSGNMGLGFPLPFSPWISYPSPLGLMFDFGELGEGGLEGPPGPQGPEGPQGPAGPAGESATAMRASVVSISVLSPYVWIYTISIEGEEGTFTARNLMEVGNTSSVVGPGILIDDLPDGFEVTAVGYAWDGTKVNVSFPVWTMTVDEVEGLWFCETNPVGGLCAGEAVDGGGYPAGLGYSGII